MPGGNFALPGLLSTNVGPASVAPPGISPHKTWFMSLKAYVQYGR
ncbi:hypothetical protein SAMN02744775_03560 [Enterobacter sp. CC120223-11]|nr:hypothetical protein SAMN02744775_03560 [Enterobacter sp. CC120223-11]